MKSLRRHLREYSDLRRSLGFKTVSREEWLLTSLLTFLRAKRANILTVDLAVEWARQPPDADPSWWGKKLTTVRGFARHAHLSDPRHQIPPTGLFSPKSTRSVPLLYSPQEVEAVLREARTIEAPLRALTCETLFGLLAVSGMRVGEVIRLDRDDVDWADNLLRVHLSKFQKSREVVLHPSVMKALRRYAEVRDRHHRKPRSPAFFVSLAGTRLIYNNVHHTFARLLRRAGVNRPTARLHDLRHTFVVQTILRWHRAGVDVDQWMPRLSTYLGHTNPASTYWYLTASPELLALVGRKLQRVLGVLA